MKTFRWLAVFSCFVLMSPEMLAQRGGGRRQQANPPADARQRPAEQIGRVLLEQLQLTEQQRTRFAEVNGRFSGRQQALNDEERTARQTVRNLMCSTDTTRGEELSRSIDQVLDIQKRRLQLVEEEQREFSAFLTPFQRARVMGFRERVADFLGERGRAGRGGPLRPGGPGRGGPPPEGGRGMPPDPCSQPPR
jgi:Spy/CpxP family protein refolding chaperone